MKIAFPTIPTAPITQIFNNYNPSMYGGDGRHKGIDYGVISGTSVYACMPGTVITAIVTQTGYGRYIKISHPDGSVSIYGHLTKLLVSVGNVVDAGQEIGKSGGDKFDEIDGDGSSTGAHLHWEIRPPEALTTDQGAVDPNLWCLKYSTEAWREAEVIAEVGLRVRSSPVDGSILSMNGKRSLLKIVESSVGWGRILGLRPEWSSEEYLYYTGKVSDPIIPPPIIPEYTDAVKLAKLWDAHPELH